jgi:hypothetical protein
VAKIFNDFLNGALMNTVRKQSDREEWGNRHRLKML